MELSHIWLSSGVMPMALLHIYYLHLTRDGTLKNLLDPHLPHLLFILTSFVSQSSPSQHFSYPGPHEQQETQMLRVRPHVLNQHTFEQDPPPPRDSLGIHSLGSCALLPALCF